MEAMMPVKSLALALMLLSTVARADSLSPFFGSAATGDFKLEELTSSVDKIVMAPQLKMSENTACSAKTCSNPRNFAKASGAASVSPQ
jgi:hypothetical protein